MKRVLALTAGLAALGAATAVAQPSPNAFVFWNLVPDGAGASLVSDRDYHAPEGLRVVFSCQPGGKRITVREYLNQAERKTPSLPLTRRDGRLRTVEGCDGACARHSDTVLKDVVSSPAELQSLRPRRYAEAQLRWNDSTKQLIDRYVLDRTQFGDARPAAVETGLARQRNLVSQFKSICKLR
ncbi:MAG: hypothetical protein IT546_07435 [Caulobacteraceae bacterium]|nr:hypothetical protein [Caulobacteraceae bacterium]